MKTLDDPAVADSQELTSLLTALSALRKGDATVRLPLHWQGVAGKVADVFNDVVEQNATMADELARLRQVVGKEGKLKQRIAEREARFLGAVDRMRQFTDRRSGASDQRSRVVIGAVAQGDLSKSMALEIEGRALEGEFLQDAINKMVDQLGTFPPKSVPVNDCCAYRIRQVSVTPLVTSALSAKSRH